jgi:hypothetical protein
MFDLIQETNINNFIKKSNDNSPTFKYHCFLDEAGDTTFYTKGKVNIVGQQGVSKAFILGSVKFKEPLDPIRSNIRKLIRLVENDPFLLRFLVPHPVNGIGMK